MAPVLSSVKVASSPRPETTFNVNAPPIPEQLRGAEPSEPAAPVIRIGGNLERARIVKQIVPEYPPLARLARVWGIVVLNAAITESGTLDDITVVSGHPLLIDAALDSVRQWRYEPARLNGIPTRTVTSIEVRFRIKFADGSDPSDLAVWSSPTAASAGDTPTESGLIRGER
jgi:protein TonB